jgi:uncharacterized membrane protein YsdA (DUF1294 family)
MNPKYRNRFRIFLIVLFGVLGLRFTWITCQSETGVEELRREWWDANTAWIVGRTRPLESRPSDEQEDFWIREVDRILQVHGDDPQIYAGAAVLLDSPFAWKMRDDDWVSESLRSSQVIPFEPQENYRGPNIRIGSGQRSLELISKATELQPANVDWWRIRALLATKRDYYATDGRLDQGWPTTLNECRKHDPNNALYDYLAAEVEWGEFDDYGRSNRISNFTDEQYKAGISRGLSYFESGLSRPYCAVGDGKYLTLSNFLRLSSLPRSEQKYCLRNCAINSRLQWTLQTLGRAQVFRSPEVYRDYDKQSITNRYQQFLSASEHIRGGMPEGDISLNSSQISMLQLIRDTAQSISLDLSDNGNDEFQRAEYEARLVGQIELELARRRGLKEEQDLFVWANLFGAYSTSVKLVCSVAASTVLPAAIVSFFVGGVLTTFASRRLPRSEQSSKGLLLTVLSLFGALILTIAFFGLFPAGIASFPDVLKVIKILLEVALPVVFIFVVYDKLQKRNFRFGIPESMMFILLLAIVLKLTLSAQQIVDAIPNPTVPIPALFWSYHAQEPIHLPKGFNLAPLDAAYQWIAYGGPYLMIFCWLVFLVVSSVAIFLVSQIQKKSTQKQSWRSILGALLQSKAQISFTTSAALLIVYLILAPSQILMTEESHQLEFAFFRDPSLYRSQLKKATDEIRADQAFMSQASAHVKAEMGI